MRLEGTPLLECRIARDAVRRRLLPAHPGPRMSYYRHHVFFCLNQRSNGEACCAQHEAQAAFDHCKKRI